MARISTHFVYPATKDFIYSISIVYGVVLSIFVLLYFYEFYKLIKYLFPNISFAALFLLTSLFIIFHFSIFKVENTNNRFMFYEIDPNYVYNYTVPNILNCILIMYLIRHNFKIKSSKVELCLLMVLGYFSIFSNLFSTGISIIIISLEFVYGFIRTLKAKTSPTNYIHSKWYSIVIFLFWSLLVLLEGTGSRAHDVGTTFNLSESISTFTSNFHILNVPTGLIILLSIIGALLLYSKNNLKEKDSQINKTLIICALCAIADSLFIILLCAKTGTSYIKRIGVLYGIVFYSFIISLISLAIIIEYFNKSVYILLLFCLALISLTYSKDKTFKESIMYNINPSSAKQVDNDIMNQIISNIQSEATSMTLTVTQSEKNDNWPHSNYIGERICNSLFELNIIDHTFPITINPDLQMNQKYNIEYR